MEPGPDLRDERSTGICVDSVADGYPPLAIVWMSCVRRIESIGELRPEIAKDLVVRPFCLDAKSRLLLPARPEEGRRATRPDETRERFIEDRLAGRIERVVSHLVNHSVHEFQSIPG